MTRNEANILGKLMKNVVENGTASALNGRGYTVAGKTGSAEFDENGSSHSWFVGYSVSLTVSPELFTILSIIVGFISTPSLAMALVIYAICIGETRVLPWPIEVCITSAFGESLSRVKRLVL